MLMRLNFPTPAANGWQAASGPILTFAFRRGGHVDGECQIRSIGAPRI